MNAFRIKDLTALILLAIVPSTGLCQVSKTTAQFLLIPPDARGRGLGEGGSVFSKGAVSPWHNPALLATSEIISAEINYCKYLPELADNLSIKNIYLSSRYRDFVYFGMGYSKFSYGKRELMAEGGYSLGIYESYESSLCFSAAVAFDHNNSFGAGVKYIQSHLADYAEASTFALDFGLLSRNRLPQATWRNDKIFYPGIHRLFREERDKGFSFGISIANLGKGMSYFDPDETDPLPRQLRLGMGYQVIDSEPVGLRFTLDATKILVGESETAWSFGLESTLYYLLNLRFGRLSDYDSRERYNTIGFGVGPEWLKFDYSRVLGEIDDWNRKSGEYSISIRCNISPNQFMGD